MHSEAAPKSPVLVLVLQTESRGIMTVSFLSPEAHITEANRKEIQTPSLARAPSTVPGTDREMGLYFLFHLPSSTANGLSVTNSCELWGLGKEKLV